MSDDSHFFPEHSGLPYPMLSDDDVASLWLDVSHLRIGTTELWLGSGINETHISFRDLVQVAAVDPWPRIEIEWRHVGGTSRRKIRPGRASGETAFADHVERLFEALGRAFPRESDRLEHGWLDHPIVPWEPAGRMPTDPIATGGQGAYRTTGREPDRIVLATRAAPGAFETLLQWLSSRPAMPWRDHPREIAVTAEYVYVTHRDGTVARLPLSELRLVRASKDDDRLYVFGRSTRLLLPHRPGCEVVAALDRVLSER